MSQTMTEQQQEEHSLVDAPAKACPPMPDDLISYILTFLPTDEETTVSTLLACRLVSRAFERASQHRSIWAPLYRWEGDIIRKPSLPSIRSEEDQQELDEIMPEKGQRRWSTVAEAYAIRYALDKIALKQLRKLVHSSSPGGRLGPFSILVAFAHVSAELLQRIVEGSTDVQERWWASEALGSSHRTQAACLWRELDSGDVFDERRQFAASETGFLCLSLFAGAKLDEIDEMTNWISTIALQTLASGLAEFDPNDPLGEANAEADGPRTTDTMPVVPFWILRSIRRTLQLRFGLTPPASTDAVQPLEAHFPSIVKKSAHARTEELEFRRMMLMTIVESNKGKGDPEKSYEEFARSFPPIISWTNYIAVVCGVVTRLPFDLKIAPGPEKDDVRILSWSGVKPKAPARYWFGFRDGALQNQKDLSKPPPAHLGISGMLHRLAKDLAASIALADSEKDRSPPTIDLDLARYGQLLVPSVVSQSDVFRTPEEKVLYLTGAALSLGAHVLRFFPFDLPHLDDLIYPLLGTDTSKEKWKAMVEKVKQDGEQVVPKKRNGEEEQPEFKVGDVVRSVQGWIGVVAGWDRAFDEDACESIEPISPEHTASTRGEEQPFYYILSNDRSTAHWSFTHYVAEDLLVTSPAPSNETLASLPSLVGFGRWFGDLIAEEEGKHHFALSAEMLARYPDDAVEPKSGVSLLSVVE